MISNLQGIKKGMSIVWDGEPYVVMEAHFLRMQQRKPVMQTKLRHIVNGKIIEYSFKQGDKVEEADLQRSKAQYLYKDEDRAYLMDMQSYEQFDIPIEQLGDALQFLKDGTEVDLLYFEGKPVNIDLPVKVTLKVTSAPPGVKGNTASSSTTKPITLETGAVVQAPLFINADDEVVVNTETGDYVERA